jgi:ELWxxDGT repeat protein
MVKGMHTSGPSNPSGLTAMNGIVYFSAKGDGKGAELWRSDGTANGTYRVKDIRKGSAGSGPYGFVAIDGLLYFVAGDGVHGYELWVSDGTAQGTRLVKDIKPGTTSQATVDLANCRSVTDIGTGVCALGSNGTVGSTASTRC